MSEATDGQQAEPGTTVLPDAPESAAQVVNASDATADDNGNETPETQEGEGEQPKPNGVQKRFAELTRDKYDAQREAAAARAEAQAYRDMLERLNGGQATPDDAPAAPAGKPMLDQFDSYEDFAEALADWKVDQRLAQRDAQQQAATVVSTFQERAAAFSAENPDFDAVITAPDLPITNGMRDAIFMFDNGPAVAYHLGQNKAEAARIAALPGFMQAAELGRLSERLTAKPATRPNPKPVPPDPITPVGGNGAVNRDPSTMSDAEWHQWRREQRANETRR